MARVSRSYVAAFWRAVRSGDLSGVAPSTYWITLGNALTWLSWGSGRSATPVIFRHAAASCAVAAARRN